jgi:hypothetical protein
VLRASIAAERAGIPAVSIVGSLFELQAQTVARTLGVDDVPLAVYPGRIKADGPEVFTEKVAGTLTDQVVEGLLHAEPRPAAGTAQPAPRDIVFHGTLDDVSDSFYDRGWTDGLPITPPTIERVEAFLAHTDRDPDEVIGVLLPDRREATVWSVAVNGVMAGCKPEYLPVLLAVAEAISDPRHKVEDGGSGVGWETLVIVSGPIIDELDFNTLAGAQRVGRRANTSIGRFARLFTRNLAGLRIPPFETDKGGLGATFPVALAENEEVLRSLGWPTHGDDLGVPAGASAVTVQSVAAESQPFTWHDGPYTDPLSYLRPLVEVYGKAMLGYWVHTGLAWASWHPLVILSPFCVRLLAEHGWDKDRVRRYLFDEARIPARDVERRGAFTQLNLADGVARGDLPPVFHESDDPDRLVPVFLTPESIRIVVAGNPDMYWQRGIVNNHAQGAPVTKIVGQRP